MFAQKQDPFISLIEKKEDTIAAVPTEAKESPPQGKMLYISNVKLPLSDEDLNQTLLAEIKFKPRIISKRIENGKATLSYDLEITSIRIKG